jgi:hypothetical protein
MIFDPVKRVLDRYEQALLGRAAPQRYPPIFILGPPRSGTTLLYQLVVNSFDVSYICNVVDEHPRYAATLTWLLRRGIRRYRSGFQSNYGRTRSMFGPSEGRRIWHRWFPDGYVDQSYLTQQASRSIQQTVGALSEALQAPFVNKDPHHCVRVKALNLLFPEALFVVITRDPIATAESMLRVRRTRAERGDASIDTWMSVKPKEFPRLRSAGHIAQVCGQAHYCAQNALDDLLAVAPRRFLLVSYADLCNTTRQTVGTIGSFLQSHGAPAVARAEVPTSFAPSAGVELPEEDRRAIRACMLEIGAPAS